DNTFVGPYSITNIFTHGYLFVDLNGDGYTDLLTSAQDSTHDVWQCNINDNGAGFLPPVPITQHHPWLHFEGNFGPERTNLVLADVNGDNRVDIVYGGDSAHGGYQVWLGNTDPRATRGGLLVAISNSIGLRTEFTYKAEPVMGRMSPKYGFAIQSFKMEA